MVQPEPDENTSATPAEYIPPTLSGVIAMMRQDATSFECEVSLLLESIDEAHQANPTCEVCRQYGLGICSQLDYANSVAFAWLMDKVRP